MASANVAGKMPNLWPPEIVSPTTLSPLAILRMQAQNLTEMTHGLLRGAVNTADDSEGNVLHFFDIVAPALNGYRHHILTIRHSSTHPIQWLAKQGYRKKQMRKRASSASSRTQKQDSSKFSPRFFNLTQLCLSSIPSLPKVMKRSHRFPKKCRPLDCQRGMGGRTSPVLPRKTPDQLSQRIKISL